MLDELVKYTLDGEFTLVNCLLMVGTSLVLGALTGLFYMYAHKDKGYNQGFIVTLSFLPTVIAVILMLVGNSVARAFSLAGVFTIVRFRSAPGEPEDIAYLLLDLAIGLACGIGYIVYGALITIIMLLALFLFKIFRFGKGQSNRMQLRIVIPENLNYNDLFEDIFEKYTIRHSFLKVKTSDFGALFTITYVVYLKKDIDQKEFIDELRCRNGNLAISLNMYSEIKFGE